MVAGRRRKDFIPRLTPGVLRRNYKYYEKKFLKYAKRIPTNELAGYFMGQYEKSFGEYQRTGILPTKMADKLEDPPTVQKALLFGIERALLLSKPWPIQWLIYFGHKLMRKIGLYTDNHLVFNCVTAEVCVTEMVAESESSDQIHGIYRNNTTLSLKEPRGANMPRESYKFLKTEIDPILKKEMGEIGDPKVENSKKKILFNGRDLPSEYDTRKKAFDKAFQEKIGASFDEVNYHHLTVVAYTSFS